MSGCVLCPRRCGIDRSGSDRGICGQGIDIRVARAAPHPFEEPCISGSRGSGTVFFVGCSLRCAFCQNHVISQGEEPGQTVSPSQLSDLFLELEAQGTHNINLVTPTHFAEGIAEALELVKHRLTIPVVWNTSGYERTETLHRLSGLVDIYMPDFKYASSQLAAKYSGAPDYPSVASEAVVEMFRQVGACVFDEQGLMRRGLLVRHLVLPANRRDSIAVLDRLAELLPLRDIRLSLMSQYTPAFADDSPYGELHRFVTSFEYNSVLSHAHTLGFEGYMQGRSSASARYTPEF